MVRDGKNDRRRQVEMDAWGWAAPGPWLSERATLPVGPLFCVVAGPTRGHAWSASAARLELHRTAVAAGVRRRVAPHQLRHAHAVDYLVVTREDADDGGSLGTMVPLSSHMGYESSESNPA